MPLLVAIALAAPFRTVTSADPDVETAVAAAEAYLGTGYRWDGRDTERLPGLDCLGVLFRSWGAATGTTWQRYPVNPSELVASGLLGDPVPGLDGVLREDVDPTALRRGDVLYLLLRGYLIPDEPLWVVGDDRYWPWHTALYLGDGVLLHAEPGGVVRRQHLDELRFDALYATRR